MKCHHAHEEITLILLCQAQLSARLRHHIETCDECREYWQQTALEHWLADTLPASEALVSQLAKSLWVDFRSSRH